MDNDIVLTSEEITNIVDDMTRLFIHDVLTSSIVLTITYKSLMALKGRYIAELKERVHRRADYVEELCDQIEIADLDGAQSPSLS